MANERDTVGRFVPGVWKGGPGRHPKAKEEAYRRIFTETIPPEKFQASCFQIWLDSVGKKINKDGQLVDDSNSTPYTRINAFGRIAAYAIGKPIQPLLVDSAEGDILAIFRQMSNEKLDQIIAQAQNIMGEVEPGSSEQNLLAANGNLESEDQ